MSQISPHPDIGILLNYSSENDIVIYHHDEVITFARLLTEVEYLDKILPPHIHLLNLYEERYYFLLGLLLGLMRNSVHLFPADKTITTFKALKDKYADILVIYDQPVSDPELNRFDLKAALSNLSYNANKSPAMDRLFSLSRLNEDNIVLFTSGSTGQPEAYKKKWTDFIQMSGELGKKLDLSSNPTILSTVPAQHMYGLEVSIMLPLVYGLSMISERPFFPADIAQILLKYAVNTLLVSTPVHYRACIKSALHLPYLQQAISSTAAMESSLADKFERLQNTTLIEIYGCTEVGVISVRQTSKVRRWTCLDDIHIQHDADGAYITTTRSVNHFILNDKITLNVSPGEKNQFLLHGRKDDLINIAGKRNSLANLNYHLLNINQLDDGCFYQIPAAEDCHQRLVVFVVYKNEIADDNNRVEDKDRLKKFIIKSLKTSVDEVFLPKSVYVVNKLPRNDTGKLPITTLNLLYQEVKKQKLTPSSQSSPLEKAAI
jgi:acyl-coenzyme A synthetase/AMP-(fatty) acid ligase